MLVTPGLHLVDGVARGAVNAYVWERADGGLTLIDTGMPGDAQHILDFVAALGKPLDRIIITHGDIDHIGALPAIQAATGARVICHAVEKDVIEGRRPRLLGYSPLAQAASRLFARLDALVFNFHPSARVHDLVLDKQMLLEGFQVIHTPGHTGGQIALFQPQRGLLITGDTLTHSRGLGKFGMPMPLATPSKAAARQSIARLAELKGIEVICFGHGAPLTDRPAERLQAYAASLT